MKTPKEKAKELVDRFCNQCHYCEMDDYEAAKQCALICVDEIIESSPFGPCNGYFEIVTDRIEDCVDYWKQVKEEIKKL